MSGSQPVLDDGDDVPCRRVGVHFVYDISHLRYALGRCQHALRRVRGKLRENRRGYFSSPPQPPTRGAASILTPVVAIAGGKQVEGGGERGKKVREIAAHVTCPLRHTLQWLARSSVLTFVEPA